MAAHLRVDATGAVQTITLDQPRRLNALSEAMLRELADALRAAERDAAVRAIVLTGAGRAFSSGADVSEFAWPEGPENGAEAHPPLGALLRQRLSPIVLRMRSMPKPILAAVNGPAAGAGMSLALACDLRFAAESAQFIQAFVGIGLVPDAGSMFFLPRLVGPGKALELAWTGDPVSATDAQGLGIVERVFPDPEVLPKTQELAARLAAGPSKAIELIKRGLTQSHELGLERMLELEANYQELAARSSDFKEGVTAFREKRQPSFHS